MVSEITHCSQTFSVNFLEFKGKIQNLKNVKKSANKFIQNKKFNILMKKDTIDSTNDLFQLSLCHKLWFANKIWTSKDTTSSCKDIGNWKIEFVVLTKYLCAISESKIY